VALRRLAIPESEVCTEGCTMRRTQFLCGAALLALYTPQLPAQQTRTPVPLLGLTAGTMVIDAGYAGLAQVGDRSYDLQLDVGTLLKKHIYLGLDFGGQFLSDRAAFTQNTTVGEKTSTASLAYVSAIAGLRSGMPSALPVALALNIGGTVTFGQRNIETCEDCHEEKLRIPGGAFLEPALLVGRGKTRFRASSRVYGGGGMRGVTSVGVELGLAKSR
jgi:hypothetical protein